MMPFSTTAYVDRTDALPGERCQFHPDCCDPDDTGCTGCGTEAIGAITFRRQHERTPGRRAAYCAEHAEFITEGVLELMQQQYAAQN